MAQIRAASLIDPNPSDKAESSGDILQARDQLGHTTVVMTEQYIRNRKGKKVSPTKWIAEQKRTRACPAFARKPLIYMDPEAGYPPCLNAA